MPDDFDDPETVVDWPMEPDYETFGRDQLAMDDWSDDDDPDADEETDE